MTRAYNTATTQQNSGGAVNPFVAGKNKIINGDFGIWQRGTSFTTSYGYVADRFIVYRNGSGATVTVSQQAFTAGTAPVAGYEGQFFLRLNQSVAGTGGTENLMQQAIEDVRTLAGQTVTVSFWAKADSARTLESQIQQFFGSGGSARVDQTAVSHSVTTSWQRFSATFNVPSVAGKTIGTGSYLTMVFRLPNNVVQTFDIWGVQVEAGSVATPFQTATGTIQGELAACQRYYYRLNATSSYPAMPYGYGPAPTSTLASPYVQFPVQMRVSPTSVDFSQLGVSDIVSASIAATSVTVSTNLGGVLGCILDVYVASGLTQYRSYSFVSRSSSAYLGFSAEL